MSDVRTGDARRVDVVHLPYTRRMHTAHSPGPWRACEGRGDHGGLCQCGLVWSIPADVPVAQALQKTEDGEISNEKFAANARLIASAPTLAANLDDALYLLDGGFKDMSAEQWNEARHNLLVKVRREGAPQNAAVVASTRENVTCANGAATAPLPGDSTKEQP